MRSPAPPDEKGVSPLQRAGRVTRRAALGVLGAAAVGYAAFGPRGAPDRIDGRVVLDYWEKWTGREGEAMRRIVDRFNASQSRVFVRYFAMAGIGQKAMIAIAGNDPPDIIGLWNFSIPAYAEAGALEPLDGMAAESGIKRENYLRAIWPMLTHRGKLWGMVNTCGSVALFYNKALFRAAGLDAERPPRTIEELDEYNAKLTTRGRDGRIERTGFIHTEPGWWSWVWGYPFGGTLYLPEFERATADSAPNVAGYRWVQGYPEKYGAKELVAFQSGLGVYGSPEHPFLTGRVAMTNQGPWLANRIVEDKKDLDYGVAPFPTAAAVYDPSRPIGLLDSDVLVIPRGAKHPREAFEFIAYTQRQENVEELSLAHCKNSPLRRVSKEFLARHPHRNIAVHAAIADSERAFLFPRTRVWPAYEKEFNAAMQRMWRLEAPAGSVLAGVQTAAQGMLDEAREQRMRRGKQ
jgi:ABC-type glycerol-3-phosphate transport system substrate-binding protein